MSKAKISPLRPNANLSSGSFALWLYQNTTEFTERMKLFQIIREGSTSELIRFIETAKEFKECLSIKDNVGVSALHITARFNKPEAAEILLKHGADPNVFSLSRGTPLTIACRLEHEELIKLLLKYGADPLISNATEGNALHMIALQSTARMAELVFKSIKPPVNSRSALGRAPLHNAAQSGNEGVCQWLLYHGADPKAKCNRQSTPFMVACTHGHINIMRMLILADRCSLNSPQHMLNEVDDEGNGPLHYTVNSNKYEAALELLQLGCSPNIQNINLNTPIHLAVVDGYTKLVRLLCNHKANLELKDVKGKTPLHKAIEHHRKDIIEILLQMGADMDTQDKKLFTPLMSACLKGNVELVTLLLTRGADANIKNNLSQTCLHVATSESQYEVLQVLLSMCDKTLLSSLDLFDQSVLYHAAKLQDVRFINLLLEYGCSVDAKNALYEIPLHLAAKSGSFEMVKLLAKVSKDINAENYENKSPFFNACEVGNREAIRALIDAGANVKDTDLRLRNTLTAAAMNGYTAIVQDLIERGVSLNSKDDEKNTALHHACANGHVDTVKVLLDSNASVTAINIHDQSPLDIAVDHCKTDVALAMIAHSSWEESLSVRDKKGATCMDRMIANTPEAVKAVLDRCVVRSNDNDTHEDHKIEFNYKYIDPGPKDPMSKKFNYNALSTMMKYDREELLSHELCQSLMVYKWRRFGKVTFAVDSFLQIGYITLMALLYFMMIRPNDPNYKCQAVTIFNNETNETLTHQMRPLYRVNTTYSILFAIYGFSLALMCRELKNAVLLGCRYLKTAPFWMTLLSVVGLNISIFPPGSEPCDDQWKYFAYSCFIFLIRETIMIQRFAKFGLYFTMFFEVFKTMIKVFVLMLFFTIAFNVPLSIMLKQDGFRNPIEGLLSTLAMTIGELNYRDNFIRADNSPFNFELGLLFPFFCILMNLSLMNLMIGVAVGDISKVESQAYLTRLKTQIKYLLDVEVMPFMWLRQKMHTDKVTVMPNKPPKTCYEKLKRTFFRDEGEILYMKKKTKSESTGEATLDVRQELDQQRVKIEELSQLTRTALEVLNSLSQTLQSNENKNSLLDQKTS